MKRIEATLDPTISELLERLLAERGIKACRAALWGFLDHPAPRAALAALVGVASCNPSVVRV